MRYQLFLDPSDHAPVEETDDLAEAMEWIHQRETDDKDPEGMDYMGFESFVVDTVAQLCWAMGKEGWGSLSN